MSDENKPSVDLSEVLKAVQGLHSLVEAQAAEIKTLKDTKTAPVEDSETKKEVAAMKRERRQEKAQAKIDKFITNSKVDGVKKTILADYLEGKITFNSKDEPQIKLTGEEESVPLAEGLVKFEKSDLMNEFRPAQKKNGADGKNPPAKPQQIANASEEPSDEDFNPDGTYTEKAWTAIVNKEFGIA